MLKVTPGMQIPKEALHKQVVPSTVVKDSWAHLMLMANLLGHKIHLRLRSPPVVQVPTIAL